jgi:predicted transcriptional regulator
MIKETKTDIDVIKKGFADMSDSFVSPHRKEEYDIATLKKEIETIREEIHGLREELKDQKKFMEQTRAKSLLEKIQPVIDFFKTKIGVKILASLGAGTVFGSLAYFTDFFDILMNAKPL